MKMTYRQLIQTAMTLNDVKERRIGGLLVTEQQALDNTERELAKCGWFYSNEIKRYVYVN